MDASEGLLRGIAWRLAFLLVLVFVARNVTDNRPQLMADAQPATMPGHYAIAGR